MYEDMKDEIITEIQALYQSDPAAKAFFDWAAERERNATETSIDTLGYHTGVPRWEATALARKLDELGCGTFVVGRRGGKSRVKWHFDVREIGKAAKGGLARAEEGPSPADTVIGKPEMQTVDMDAASVIEQAKALLSKRLGVSMESIEITIRV